MRGSPFLRHSATEEAMNKGVRLSNCQNYFRIAASVIGAATILLLETITARPAMQASPEIKITIDRNIGPQATNGFKFRNVPSPVKDDAGESAQLLLVDGEMDEDGANLGALTDGLLPAYEDAPDDNFFFNAGTYGGRFRMDFGSPIEIAEVNSYSWHPGARGPQVYALYASDGSDPKFNPTPKGNVDPVAAGWKWIATVDTRQQGNNGGQYGVSITSRTGSLGKYRYLLFVCYVTEADDDFGNTFYSEIDVVAKK
jgi:hypothetical protein